ncbi:MAG: Calx-beta domain-containing protein [Pseudomonadales bacterium]|nr:Calx-beta domain-containing protein [Pseudomonadales bacterium]
MGIEPTYLQVDRTGAGDSTGPTVTDLTLSTATVDIDASPNGFVVVDVTLEVNDGGGSGVSSAQVQFYDVSTFQYRSIEFGPGQTQRKILFSTADDDGQWEISVSMHDFAGNQSYLGPLQLRPLPNEITVKNGSPGRFDVTAQSFADPDLLACVQAHGSYIDEITSIYCGESISDLTGIEALFALETVDINTSLYSANRNSVVDLTAMLSLPVLVRLHVAGNLVTDIPSLPGLVGLNIGYNPIADLSPIEDMDGLRRLRVDGLSVDEDDIIALVTGKNLDLLSISETDIQSLSFLSGSADPPVSFSTLRIFNLSNLTLTDVTGLESLDELEELNASWSRVTDVTELTDAVGQLSNLINLSLGGLGIADLDFLSSLTRLKFLYLVNNLIDDVTPLSSPIQLRTLYLDSNLIRDVTALQSLSWLNQLSLNDNALTDDDLGQLILADFDQLLWLTLDRNLFTADGAADVALGNLFVANGGVRADYRNTPLSSRVSAASFIPIDVNLDDGDQNITFAVAAARLDAGEVDYVCIDLANPANTASIGTCYTGDTGSGGIGTIHREAQRGPWRLSASVEFENQYERFDSAKLAELGIGPTFLQVNGTGPGDSAGPTLRELSLSTTTVDIDSSPNGYIVVSVTLVTDDGGGSGVSSAYVQFYNGSTGQYRSIDFGRGETQRNIVFSTADDAGQWEISVSMYDLVGNSSYLNAADLRPLPDVITVINANPGALPTADLIFADPDLASCVQDHGAFIHEITYLNCNEGISVLGGIEQLFALEDLDVSTNLYGTDPNTLDDLTPVSSLPALRYLSFNENRVEDLSGLTGLQLSSLNMAYNPVTDFADVFAMTSLTTLNVRDIKTIDLAQVANLVNLNSLNINNIGYGTSLTPILALPLTSLHACHLGISDVSFVSSFPDLTHLNLCDNLIEDISAIAQLSGLQSLELGSNRISDISALAALNLNNLDLGSNLISDITALQNHTAIEGLNLYYNAIVDLGPLAGLTNLTYLYLGDNRVTDAAPLGNMINLRTLDLSENGISDIDWFPELTSLDWLNLRGNLLTNEMITVLEGVGIGVIAGNPDAPAIDVVALSRTQVDVDLGDQEVELSVSFASVDVTDYCVNLNSPGRVGNLSYCAGANDTSPHSLVIPAGAARGDWTLQIDVYSNSSSWSISTAALGVLGFDNIVEVLGTGLGDYKRPVLNDLIIGADILDVGLDGAVLALETDAVDNETGIASIRVFASGAWPDVSLGRNALLDTGSQTGYLQILATDPPGLWKIDSVSIEDGAGHVSYISVVELRRQGFMTEFEVVAPDQTDDDGDGFGNGYEALQGTNPNDIDEFPGSGGMIFMPSGWIAVSETSPTAEVTLRRGLSSVGEVSVDLQTRDGSATDGNHYTAVTQTVTWLDGDTSDKIVSIPLAAPHNTDITGLYLFNALLRNPTGGSVLGASDTAVFIQDAEVGGEDGLPYGGDIHFGNGALNLIEGQSNSLRFVRRGSATGSVTVTYNITSTVDSPTWEATAEPNVDFVEVISGTVMWADGDADDKIVAIDVLDDGLQETTEMLRVQLVEVTGDAAPELGPVRDVLGRVVDIDRISPAGVIGVAQRLVLFDEENGIAEIPVSRLYGGQGNVSVGWHTDDGTAIEGQDYQAELCCGSAIVWAPGDMSQKVIRVPIMDDAIVDNLGDSEFFDFVLFDLSGSESPQFDRSTDTFALGFPVIMDLVDNRTTDTDGDLVIDVGDLDDDNDGVRDFIDNCRLAVNADQLDFDGDTIGDACDDDDDNDGVPDIVDPSPLDPKEENVIELDFDAGASINLFAWDRVSITDHSPILPGSDVRNMLIGNFGAFETENTLFTDGLTAGTVHFVEFSLPVPEVLDGFSLSANGDGALQPGRDRRSITEFKLLGKASGAAEYTLLSEFVVPATGYGILEVSKPLITAPVQDIRIEFT